MITEAKLLTWRDPADDPPELTGVILVLLRDMSPALVDVEES
jgi:hypothetical protein